MFSCDVKRSRPARHLVLLLALSGLAALVGCASARIAPIDASQPIALAPDEGLLILQIDTEVALHDLILSRRSIARSLGKGQHIWLVRVRAGSYRWQQIEIGDNPRYRRIYEIDSDDEMRFDVQAGVLNYPGELVIREGPSSSWGYPTLIVRNRNHAAMAVRALQKRDPRILEARTLRYAGSSKDAFLDYYTHERDERKAYLESAAKTESAANTDSAAEKESSAEAESSPATRAEAP